MRRKKIPQKHFAEMMGIQQPAFSHRLEKGLFKQVELIMLFRELEATEEEVLKFMKA